MNEEENNKEIEMSEDNILHILNDFIIERHKNRCANPDYDYKSIPLIDRAVHGLLDLYQKEKDKNKELQTIQETNNSIKANINRNILNKLYDKTKEENIDFYKNKINEEDYLLTLSKIYYNLNFNNIGGNR